MLTQKFCFQITSLIISMRLVAMPTNSPVLKIMTAFPSGCSILNIIGNNNVQISSLFKNGYNSFKDCNILTTDVQLVSSQDIYFSVGMPIEEKILSQAKLINPLLRDYSLTNHCHVLQANPFIWLSMSNIEQMRSNALMALGKTAACCGQQALLRGYFKNRRICVVATSKAFEYLCQELGIEMYLISVKDLKFPLKFPSQRHVAILATPWDDSEKLKQISQQLDVEIVTIDVFEYCGDETLLKFFKVVATRCLELE